MLLRLEILSPVIYPMCSQSTTVFPPIHCSQYGELLSICQNPTQPLSSPFLQDLVILSIILAWNVSHVQVHCLTRDHFCYLFILIDDKVLERRVCLLLLCLSTLYIQGQGKVPSSNLHVNQRFTEMKRRWEGHR